MKTLADRYQLMQESTRPTTVCKIIGCFIEEVRPRIPAKAFEAAFGPIAWDVSNTATENPLLLALRMDYTLRWAVRDILSRALFLGGASESLQAAAQKAANVSLATHRGGQSALAVLGVLAAAPAAENREKKLLQEVKDLAHLVSHGFLYPIGPNTHLTLVPGTDERVGAAAGRLVCRAVDYVGDDDGQIWTACAELLRGLAPIGEKPITDNTPTDNTGWEWSRLWRNWPVHNLISHPLSEIVYWVFGEKAAGWVHDTTIPPHKPGTGRG